MQIIEIGDIILYSGLTYFVIGHDNNKYTIVKKSGKHSTFKKYQDDFSTGLWDKKYTIRNVEISKLKLLNSENEQDNDGQ